MDETKKIALGSGKLYITSFDGEMPDLKTMIKDENILGYIQGGASVEYTPKYYTAKDDLGLVKRKIITDEEAKLKSGVMTWNGNTLKKLCSTARVSEKTSGGIKTRTVKIGGIKNYDGKKYVLLFVNDDAEFGQSRVAIVGSNEGSLSFTYAKEKETVINVEFTAEPHDNDGTLILYEEDIEVSTEEETEAIVESEG